MTKKTDQTEEDIIIKKTLKWMKEKENTLYYPLDSILLFVLGVKSDEDEGLKMKFKDDIEFLNQPLSASKPSAIKSYLHPLKILTDLRIKELIKYKTYLRELYIADTSDKQVVRLLERIENYYTKEKGGK